MEINKVHLVNRDCEQGQTLDWWDVYVDKDGISIDDWPISWVDIDNARMQLGTQGRDEGVEAAFAGKVRP